MARKVRSAVLRKVVCDNTVNILLNVSCSNLKIEAEFPAIFAIILLFLLNLGKIKVSLASNKSFRFAYLGGSLHTKLQNVCYVIGVLHLNIALLFFIQP